MRILGDQPQTDPHATIKRAIAPPGAIDPATLQDQLQTGELTQAAYEEAWTVLIATVPTAVLKASMEKRQDAAEAAGEQATGVATA
jgi:hypothetical protein